MSGQCSFFVQATTGFYLVYHFFPWFLVLLVAVFSDIRMITYHCTYFVIGLVLLNAWTECVISALFHNINLVYTWYEGLWYGIVTLTLVLAFSLSCSFRDAVLCCCLVTLALL